LHIELKDQLEDVLTGIENTNDMNKTVQDCINRAFKLTDEKFAKIFPKECK